MDNNKKMDIAFKIIDDMALRGYCITNMGQVVYMIDGIFTDADTGKILDLNYEDFDEE